MASVTLTEVHVHDAANLSDFVRSHGFGSASQDASVRGEVRTYGGGRRRVIRRKGKSQNYDLTMPAVSSEVLAWLEDHVGEPVMVRDPQGQLLFGVYFEVDSDLRPGAGPDVSLTVESVSMSAEV